MVDPKSRISDLELGERLRVAREGKRITQLAAADAIGAARTTIVAIEQGKRRVQLSELQKLASTFGTTANALLRRSAVHLDLVPRFRKLREADDEAVVAAAELLNDLVRAEVELEDALGVVRGRHYPPERPILAGELYSQAESAAQELRDWLGIGPGPIRDIVALLDLQLGIRVYVRRIESRVSGLFAFDERAGACILLNANHPYERMVQSAAHELGHFVSARKQPEALRSGDTFESRAERYASIFQRCFLTPGRELRQRFAEITAGQSHLSRRHVIILAEAFGVSREAVVRRLEELELVRKGTWDWFDANGGISEADVRQALGAIPERQPYGSWAQAMLPVRLTLLAREAWRKELYSEGQLAHLLGLDLHGIREVLDGADQEAGETDELFLLLP